MEQTCSTCYLGHFSDKAAYGECMLNPPHPCLTPMFFEGNLVYYYTDWELPPVKPSGFCSHWCHFRPTTNEVLEVTDTGVRSATNFTIIHPQGEQ